MSENHGEILAKLIKYHYQVAKSLLIFGIICTLIYLWQLWHFYSVSRADVDNSVSDNSGAVIADSPVDEKQSDNTELSLTVVVDIAGAVKTPGIYRLKQNARLNDLILLAGGFLQSQVDRGYISRQLNLATKLVDGEKYYIPYWHDRGESGEISQIATTSKTQKAALSTDKQQQTEKVSLNHASSSELEKLSGIGKVRSQAIISNRPYQDIVELVEKKIISEKLFNQLKEHLKL